MLLIIVTPVILVDPALQPTIGTHAPATAIQPIVAGASVSCVGWIVIWKAKKEEGTYPSAFVQVQGPFQFLPLHS